MEILTLTFLFHAKICPIYSKEPHVFHADIKRSEVEDIFQLASDWINFAQKNVKKSKAVALLGSLL